jgi:hypothetical protein
VQKTPIVGTPGRGICSVLSLSILMVHSPKLIVIADDKHQIGVSFALGETVNFRSLEFIVDHFSSLRLSDKGNVSGSMFMGMAHNGSSSLHTILEDSVNKGDTTSSGGSSSGFPISRECNVLTLSVPIMTTPPSKDSSTPLTIVTILLWTTAP